MTRADPARVADLGYLAKFNPVGFLRYEHDALMLATTDEDLAQLRPPLRWGLREHRAQVRFFRSWRRWQCAYPSHDPMALIPMAHADALGLTSAMTVERWGPWGWR